MADGEIDTAQLEDRIGYRFTNCALLRRSLTHPSFQGDAGEGNYQRLEFLGDAVLGLVLAEQLFKSLPDKREGALTRCRSMLVKGQQLSKLLGCDQAQVRPRQPLPRQSQHPAGGLVSLPSWKIFYETFEHLYISKNIIRYYMVL